MNMIEHVLTVVDRYKDRVFLIDSIKNDFVSFGEFHRLACKLAERILEKGIQHGDRVAIILNNSPEFAMLYFACLYLGVAAVPINLQLHKREIEFILRNSGARMAIYSPSTKELIPPTLFEQDVLTFFCLLPKGEDEAKPRKGDAWSVYDKVTKNVDGWKPFKDVFPDDLFSLTFTSGTTSFPKGVPHRIDSLLRSAVSFNKELDFSPENRFYHVLSMAYMAGFLNTLLCPFLAGSSVVISRAFDARLAINFWDAPVRFGVNTLWLVPTILQTLMRIDRSRTGPAYSRGRVSTVCVGTALLPLKLKRDFEEKYGVQLLESYGLSETLFVTTNSKNIDYLPGSVGKTLPGIALKIVDEFGAELPIGKDGEIWVRTPLLMTGYLNHQTFHPDAMDPLEWFPSGDIGHLGSDGHLFITDRKKDLIIKGGINISPRLVEDVLMEHKSILQVAVVGLPNEFYGEEVVAIMELKAGYTLDGVRQALDVLCKENLNAFSVPTRFFQLDDYPKSTTGKIKKAELRKLLAAGPSPLKG